MLTLAMTRFVTFYSYFKFLETCKDENVQKEGC